MSEDGQSSASAVNVDEKLRRELAHGDAIIATAGPIVRHMLLNDDQTLFNDEVIARIRGIAADVASQLLSAVTRYGGIDDFRQANVLAWVLLDNSAFLSHAHAMAIEALVSERLCSRSDIDPLRSQVMVELSSSSDTSLAQTAKRALAAQALFIQRQRRMELALAELPQDLFDAALIALDAGLTGDPEMIAKAVADLREAYDLTDHRADLLKKLGSIMPENAMQLYEIDQAGVALFVTALSVASGPSRNTTIFSLGERQSARLALALRAAGCATEDVEEQMQFLHPEFRLFEGFDELAPNHAKTLLAGSPTEVET